VSDYRGPTGTIIHDPDGDRLREETRWTIIEDDGRVRELRLRVARGRIVETATKEDDNGRG
jgi:hypothetical protein